ncbi:MAG TPA: M48 family metalloprotease [Pyrinomonadaceae bacterium]|nr:M48 family metalloprotease [Pyrinomonadaceae bacterium]
MKYFSDWLIAGLLICFLFTGFSIAQDKERDSAKEEKIWQELQKNAPKAVETFKAATLALDQKNYQESARLYAEVLKQSPNFEPALRRSGYALIAAGKRDEGLAMTQKAVNLNRTTDNLMGHALALTAPGASNSQPPKSNLDQAFVLAKEAIQKATETDSDYLVFFAQLALSTNHLDDFKSSVKTLKDKFPELAATHYFNGIKLANDGELEAAETEIKAAENLGLPREATTEILAAIEKEKGKSYFGLGNYFFYGLYLVGAWLLGLAVLFVAGKILSAKTLHSIENSDPNDITGGGQAGLRGIYKKLIAIAGIYYYLSQPIVMLLVIVAAGGIVLFFLWIGSIPVKLVLIVGFVALATLFYMVKSLVIRAKAEDPGRVLTEAEAPALWALVREVAAAVNTRPVNEIRITHGAELAVYERGGMRVKMQDKAERILIVGLAALKGFHQNAFRAVLAHEYGHFSNRDTAGGDIAMHVNNDIIRLAESMGRSGTATVYNIAFQFLRFYHFLFRRITHGASRLQEILADRVAVYQYGADAFREGLAHVIRRDIEFNHIAESEINAAFNAGRALQNLYEMMPQDENISKSLEQEYNEYLSRPTTEDDTHPSPKDRFKLIAQIKCRETAPIDGQVWDLFRDKNALTIEMNDLLEARLKAMM